MTLAFAGATTWVFSKTNWDQTDSTDSRKVFAQEYFKLRRRTSLGCPRMDGSHTRWETRIRRGYFPEGMPRNLRDLGRSSCK